MNVTVVMEVIAIVVTVSIINLCGHTEQCSLCCCSCVILISSWKERCQLMCLVYWPSITYSSALHQSCLFCMRYCRD